MATALFIDKHNIPIGLKRRKSTIGPETDMVNEFIDSVTTSFKHKRNKLAVFVEPMVGNSYPDIVFAEYNPDILDKWNDARNNIEIIDIKILENLRAMKGGNSEALYQRTHFAYKSILQSIERLYDAGFIERKNKSWKPKPLKELYSIRKLVSVEAKINDMQILLNQADANKWFASESYALSGSKKPQKSTIQQFRERGIGLYGLNNGKILEFNKPIKQKLPTSYMSWMFNEWVGRYTANA